jgi:hypothetical protein
MKTHRDLLVEARRLEGLGSEYTREGDFSAARVLLSLPDSSLRQPSVATEERAVMRRWIDVAMVEGMLEYRLWESGSTSEDAAKPTEPRFVTGSDSAFDVLAEGYERCERDRLAEALAPFAERAERKEIGETIDPTLVEEIEEIVEADELSPAARLHAKADIVGFLEGRLDPSDFINVAINRQYRREMETEAIEQRAAERMAIEQF